MAEDVFGEAAWQRTGNLVPKKRRRGNPYALYTRKFSLGNGPRLWVQEYLITKEGGKMLGTLVALAVARMRNLETFIWDMPTGILRDVWLALSSLGDRDDGQQCRLERLWVRWHDNRFPIGNESSNSTIQPPIPLGPMPPPPNNVHASGAAVSHASHTALSAHPTVPSLPAQDRVEHPTFSVLPPLKSVSVLDIDELSYLDEMSILIGESKKRLKELRVGIAGHAQHHDWVTAWEGEGVQQLDEQGPLGTRSGDKRLGGVLGILVGRVHDLRRKPSTHNRLVEPVVEESPDSVSAGLSDVQKHAIEHAETGVRTGSANADSIVPIAGNEVINTERQGGSSNVSGSKEGDLQEGGTIVDLNPSAVTIESPSVLQTQLLDPSGTDLSHDLAVSQAPDDTPLNAEESMDLSAKLRLDILELERVPLSVPVLQRALDWSTLTSLTLLHCLNHEQLWKTLRRTFSPFAGPKGDDTIAPSGEYREGRGQSKAPTSVTPVYGLSLKKIHTNAVSSSLISFIKETLAPNSLEVLFLQEARSYSSNVTIDTIYRGALRRHRSSLRKLLIDSSEKGSDGRDTGSSRWRRWILNREILGYITSGRMASLRELGVAVDYRDWVRTNSGC